MTDAKQDSAAFDVAVIGGGIAGVSAARAVADTHSVVILEQENELAHHSTSRSAAIFVENEGGPIFHRLATASRPFLETEHSELDAPLLDPLPVLKVGSEAERPVLQAEAEQAAQITSPVRLIDDGELYELAPMLNPEFVSIGVYEPTAASVDVMALHQLYLRRARNHGAQVRRSARVTALSRAPHGWTIETTDGTVGAAVVINAAGAWGDVVGQLAGAKPLGLTPKRRTAFTSPVDADPTDWPFVYSQIADRTCYFKPEAGNQLLCSLSEENPTEPCDAKPEEIDVAQAIDNINHLTTLGLRSVNITWTGLRTFAPDRNPVFGWDDSVDGFLWLVGQGGCGIVSSAAAGDVAAALIREQSLPAALTQLGVTEQDLAPRR